MTESQDPQDLSKAPQYRDILNFSVPLMLGMLTFGLHGVVDAAFIGRLGTEQMAGLGMGNAYYIAAIVLFLGIVRNVVAFTGRSFGGGRSHEIGPLLVQYQWLALASLPAIWAIALGFPWLVALAKMTPQVAGYGATYLYIRIWEAPFILLIILYGAYHQSKGNSRMPMMVHWAVLGVNVLLDYVLIFGKLGMPAMGIAGSATATVIANMLGATLLMGISHTRSVAREERLKILGRPNWGMLREIIRVSLPLGLGDFLEMSSWLLFFAIVGRLGTVALAANNIAIQIAHIVFLPGFAVGISASSYMGRYLGADAPKLARLATRRTLFVGMAYMGLAGAPLWFFGSLIASGFTSDAGVIAAASIIFKIMALYQVCDAVGMILRSALSGAGDTRWPMVVLPILSVTVLFPAAWLLSDFAEMGVLGAYLGEALFVTALAALMLFRFERGPWPRMKLRTA